jgi:beta-N-acetylhexosaminidase
MTDLLRGEMAFSGLAVSDALDMRGVSAGRGIPEAAVLALAAGCDALCVGASTGGEIVDEIAAAIVDAVRRGRLGEARLREAAGRIDALAAWRKRQGDGVEADRAIGLEAARRALCREGDVSVRDRASVVSFASGPSIAAGAVPWGMAAALAALGVEVADAEVPHRTLVIVVRDLHRLPEQRAAVEALIARRGDAVVVDMGVPVYRPHRVRGYLATYGAARVCAQAAAEVMHP